MDAAGSVVRLVNESLLCNSLGCGYKVLSPDGHVWMQDLVGSDPMPVFPDPQVVYASTDCSGPGHVSASMAGFVHNILGTPMVLADAPVTATPNFVFQSRNTINAQTNVVTCSAISFPLSQPVAPISAFVAVTALTEPLFVFPLHAEPVGP